MIMLMRHWRRFNKHQIISGSERAHLCTLASSSIDDFVTFHASRLPLCLDGWLDKVSRCAFRTL